MYLARYTNLVVDKGSKQLGVSVIGIFNWEILVIGAGNSKRTLGWNVYCLLRFVYA